MAYVDGFIVPVPKAKLDAYRELATKAASVWREHGALEYHECIAEDVKTGVITSFPQAVELEPDEIVVFAWIVYESREHRDQVNEKAMNDPRMAKGDPESMPFDEKRMIYGGFSSFVTG